jgi:DNA invertase Pin-like site-specific DNA recombinase
MAQTAVIAQAFTALDLAGGERNLIGLARVSTDAQDAQLQQDALTEAGCARIYIEKISTRKAATDRPGLVAALDYLRAGDTLVVWKLDRLGRSVKDVLTIADSLHARGIGVRILTGKLSGSYSPTGEGKFFFTMMAAFAELERDIIHERTMAGLVAARARGRNGGRPTVMDEDKLAAARARRARGESPRRSPGRSGSAGRRCTGTWPLRASRA